MQEPDRQEEIRKLVEGDEVIIRHQKKIEEYKGRERERIAGVREEIAALQKQMQSLRATITRKRNLLRIKKGPIRTIERRIRTRRNLIIRNQEKRDQKEYAKMFRVKKNNILRI